MRDSVEIDEIKNIFHTANINTTSQISLNRLTISVESDSTITMINEIKLALLKNKPNVKLKKEITKLYKQNLVSPYALNSSMYNAIYRLRYKAYLNIKALRLFYPQKLKITKKYLTGYFDSFFLWDEISFIQKNFGHF